MSAAMVGNRRTFLRHLVAGGVAVPAWFATAVTRAGCGSCVDLSGRWCGTWLSYCNGHHGKLNGVLTRDACGDYRARFTGTFWKVFPFIYPTTLNVVDCRNGTVYFRGSQNIPLLGEFCYGGHATCDTFCFRYSSKKDRGVFQMSR